MKRQRTDEASPELTGQLQTLGKHPAEADFAHKEEASPRIRHIVQVKGTIWVEY